MIIVLSFRLHINHTHFTYLSDFCKLWLHLLYQSRGEMSIKCINKKRPPQLVQKSLLEFPSDITS